MLRHYIIEAFGVFCKFLLSYVSFCCFVTLRYSNFCAFPPGFPSFLLFCCLDVVWMFDYTKARMVKDLPGELIVHTHPSISIAAGEVFVPFHVNRRYVSQASCFMCCIS